MPFTALELYKIFAGKLSISCSVFYLQVEISLYQNTLRHVAKDRNLNTAKEYLIVISTL